MWEDVSNIISSQSVWSPWGAGNQCHAVATSQIEAALAWKHLRRMVGNEVYKWLSHYNFIFPASLVFLDFFGAEFLKSWQFWRKSPNNITKECQPVHMSMNKICHKKTKYIFVYWNDHPPNTVNSTVINGPINPQHGNPWRNGQLFRTLDSADLGLHNFFPKKHLKTN